MVFTDADTVVTITDGEGNTVYIVVTKVTHNLDKQLIIFPMPKKQESDTVTYLIDLNRAKEAVTVTGYLLDESDSSASTKKTALLNMCRKISPVGGLTLTFNSESFTGNIEKWDITYETGRVGNEGNATWEDTSLPGSRLKKTYSVMLVFVRGVFKG